MKRLFLSISKGEELRFLGHLDMLRAMERAIVRSEIPIAFSEGFNPHMKIAFDAALGVGVTADPLYLEIKLEKDFLPEKVSALLTPQLPKGIILHEIKEVGLDSGKLVTFLNEDVYEMEGPVNRQKDISQTEENITRFNALDSFIYERVTPKKVRQIDVKPMIIQPVKVNIQGDRAYLKFSLVRSQSGSVQPKDMWKMLAEFFDMPWLPDAFICSRTGTYYYDGIRRSTPFSESIFFENLV